MTKAKLNELLLHAWRLQRLISSAREAYRELDAIAETLSDEAPIGIAKDFTYKLTDLFEEKNTQWRSTPFRRFELTINTRRKKK